MSTETDIFSLFLTCPLEHVLSVTSCYLSAQKASCLLQESLLPTPDVPHLPPCSAHCSPTGQAEVAERGDTTSQVAWQSPGTTSQEHPLHSSVLLTYLNLTQFPVSVIFTMQISGASVKRSCNNFQ